MSAWWKFDTMIFEGLVEFRKSWEEDTIMAKREWTNKGKGVGGLMIPDILSLGDVKAKIKELKWESLESNCGGPGLPGLGFGMLSCRKWGPRRGFA